MVKASGSFSSMEMIVGDIWIVVDIGDVMVTVALSVDLPSLPVTVRVLIEVLFRIESGAMVLPVAESSWECFVLPLR